MKKLKVIFMAVFSLTIAIGVCACSSVGNVKQTTDDSKYQYVKDFEKLGLGMFIHYGLYSEVGKGEWYLNENPEADMATYEKLTETFDVDANWANDIVDTAKSMGAKYITITTRHHDGFSLYDTKGLNTYDAPHSKCHRDLIREFVDACNANGIKPFFYHTLLDWHEPSYKENFDAYLDYLYNSVEILCKNYGEIGGFWFDGTWDQTDTDWKMDRLYTMIKSYQPNAMIINNTGLDELGAVSHPMVDSVTYERGKPKFAKNTDRPRAGEMCESITDHWGYAQDDISFKSVEDLIDMLCECRENNCNMLLNVGPLANGTIDSYEKYTLQCLGRWIADNKNFIYNIKGTDISAENAVIVKDDNHYYAIIKDTPMKLNSKADEKTLKSRVKVNTGKHIVNAKYLDNDQVQEIENNVFYAKPYSYGKSFHTRVLQFDLE